MAKFVVALFTLIVALTIFEQCTALECYTCETACEVNKAKKTSCGSTISSSMEAFCVTKFPMGKENAAEKVRTCEIVNKGQEPACPQGDTCVKCKTDLCNKAPLTGSNMALALAAIFLAKLFV